jgi:hypothetical protein
MSAMSGFPFVVQADGARRSRRDIFFTQKMLFYVGRHLTPELEIG